MIYEIWNFAPFLLFNLAVGVKNGIFILWLVLLFPTCSGSDNLLGQLFNLPIQVPFSIIYLFINYKFSL